MTLQELKIALDWAESNLRKAESSNWNRNEDRFKEALQLWKRVKDKFDVECKDYITKLPI